eukprot:TRINITY_DN1443_c0_g1_i2.p1 TRINITY_DN1443_c0_g1~~TRINITY_DN1443_c0_g1_i2.p1  ORF type:complete len:174 (+),score=49.02 TRINITY_DN1443_c0_g1_i2:23-523(+)
MFRGVFALCCVAVVGAAREHSKPESQIHDGKFMERLATQMTEVMVMGLRQGYGEHTGSKLADADSVKVGLRIAMNINEKLDTYRGNDLSKEAEMKAYQMTIVDLKREVFKLWPIRRSLDAEENSAVYTIALYLRAAFPELREEVTYLLDDEDLNAIDDSDDSEDEL